MILANLAFMLASATVPPAETRCFSCPNKSLEVVSKSQSPPESAIRNPQSTIANPQSPSELVETVQHYLLADDAAARNQMADRVALLAGGDIRQVIEALGQVRLWVQPAAPAGRYNLDTAAGVSIPVGYELPPGYDPDIAYPLIVLVPPQSDASDADTLTRRYGFQSCNPPPIVLRPSALPGGAFNIPPTQAAGFGSFVRDACRRFHVDTDRVCLIGDGRGADAAWQLAIANADLIAGLCVTNGYLRVPYARQVYPFLLDNLADVAVFDGWVLSEGPPTPTSRLEEAIDLSERDLMVAAHNRAMIELARRRDRPWLAEEFSNAAVLDHALAQRAYDVVFSRRRPAPSRQTERWFRYADHGRATWVRVLRPAEPQWEASQLSILPGPEVDQDRFIADVIQSKLGYLRGRIEGQQIIVKARNCERLEVRLYDGLVDFGQPVELICNGKVRFQGRLEPRVLTLLRCARQDWEFNHPILAVLTFRMDGVARQE